MVGVDLCCSDTGAVQSRGAGSRAAGSDPHTAGSYFRANCDRIPKTSWLVCHTPANLSWGSDPKGSGVWDDVHVGLTAKR